MPAGGLISTVRDFAQFDLALKKGLLLRPDTLAAARRPAVGAGGRSLPHGLGWFVQNYRGETIVWQFGITPNTSSSLIVTLPARGVTLVLLANSDGLARIVRAGAGDGRRDDVAVRAAVPRVRGTVRSIASRDMRAALLAVVILLLSPVASSAEWQARPFLGISFAADTTFVLTEGATAPNVVIGGNGALLGDVFGIEADFGWRPGFFQSGDEPLVRGNSVTTLTGNAIIAVPRHLTRYTLAPYFVVGGGLMHVHIEDFAGFFPIVSNLPVDGHRRWCDRVSDEPDRPQLGGAVFFKRRGRTAAWLQRGARAPVVLAREHGARHSVVTRSVR